MPDTKISAAADIVSLNATDMLPVARSGSTTAYRATMAEIGTYIAVPAASSTTPAMDGTAAVGTGTTWARADHVHPTDTSRAPLASPPLTGSPTAPTVTPATDSSTKLATTAFVQSAMTAAGAGVSSWNTRAGAVTLQQSDIVAVGALHDVGRNRLHNSGFTINQRSYATGTALAAGVYAHDRWKAGASGCTYTFTQSYPTTTITITAGSLQQIIEARDVAGGTYTLSWTGTAQGRVNAGTYAASPVTTAGLAANTAITVEFNTGTVGSVQFEAGTQATPLDAGGSPQQILAQCQRFYQAMAGMLATAYASGGVFSNTYIFGVPMRIAPTVNIANISYGGAGGSALALNAATPFSFRVQYTQSAAGMSYAAFDVTLSADL